MGLYGRGSSNVAGNLFPRESSKMTDYMNQLEVMTVDAMEQSSDAARRTEREEDVELAIVKSFGMSAEPPNDWKDSLHPIDGHR
jgi:hypothetical protein